MAKKGKKGKAKDTGWVVEPSKVLKGTLDQVRNYIETLLSTLGDDFKEEIRRRVEDGRSGANRKFSPYAESTREQKAEEGKRTSPSLQDTGDMLNSLFVDKTKLKNFYVPMVGVGVKGTDRNGISNAQKARWLARRKNYHFLKWTRSYESWVREYIRKYMIKNKIQKTK